MPQLNVQGATTKPTNASVSDTTASHIGPPIHRMATNRAFMQRSVSMRK